MQLKNILLLLPLLCVEQLLANDDGPEDGAEIYHDYCSVCHGDKGDGNSRAKGSFHPPPKDFTKLETARMLSRDRMIFSVTYGRADTAMAGWGKRLGKERVVRVVDYIRSTFMQLDKLSEIESSGAIFGPVSIADGIFKGGAFDSEYMFQPMPMGLEGVAKWGEIFYNGNCAICHGVNGDGKGPRAYFILPKPRDYRHPAARHELNRSRLFESIAQGSHGAEMPAWDKVLTYQEIAHVAEYIFQTFIRPEELNAQPE